MTAALAAAVSTAAPAAKPVVPCTDAAEPGPGSLQEHRRKSWDFFRSLGSPELHVAPMVDQVGLVLGPPPPPPSPERRRANGSQALQRHHACSRGRGDRHAGRLVRSPSWYSGCCAGRMGQRQLTHRCCTAVFFRSPRSTATNFSQPAPRTGAALSRLGPSVAPTQ